MSNWKMIEKGRWAYNDGSNTAETHRVREGIIHSSEWMWTTTLNGEWLTNADSLADAREAVTAALTARKVILRMVWDGETEYRHFDSREAAIEWLRADWYQATQGTDEANTPEDDEEFLLYLSAEQEVEFDLI